MKKSVKVFNEYATVSEMEVDCLLRQEILDSNFKIVVLDDDPTGVQTVHQVPVYTDWKEESMRRAFREKSRLFFVLTNSRGLTALETEAVHREIASTVHTAAKETEQEYLIISRGDSTLRGHYPLETDVLRQEYEANTGVKIDGEILCPFFKEGGRFTIDNIHYAKYGEELIPVNETEFAKDSTFGYRAASLPEYIEEKTESKFGASQVLCISLEELRGQRYEQITEKLCEVKDFQKIVVNAIDYVDVKVFGVALYRALKCKKHFMFRTAAAFVKVMGGVADRPLLSREEMIEKEVKNGGIIVIGSHTGKTTKQLECLKQLSEVHCVELDVSKVTEDVAFEREVQSCLAKEMEWIKKGQPVCCYTSRKLIVANSDNKEDHLKISTKISDAVQALVGKLEITPAFVVAKGGITSSDVGTKALKVKRALVLGQIKPGIPVWKTGEESRFPGIPYIIFPGNVGEDNTLREVVEILGQKR